MTGTALNPHTSLGQHRPMRGWHRVLATALMVLVVAFVALPLVAIVVRVPPTTLLRQAASTEVLLALRVSIVTSVIAHILVLAFGTPLAYILARHEFRGKALMINVLELPIVLPPAVAGIGLLAAYGRMGLLGEPLGVFGVSLPFTSTAVVMAVVFVSGPFYLRQALAAFGAVPAELLDSARTLGASPWTVFIRIAVPVALSGLEAGSALALARGFGEFGATIMFAGSLPGVTQTLPLAVYALMDLNFDAALAASTLLIAIGIAILLSNRWVLAWTRSQLT